MTDRYAVVGNPVAHSLSPRIHAAFARETSQDIEYTRMLAPLDAFKPALLQFRDDGGRGINVTLPFKYQAWQFVDAHASGALEANAVNTIHFNDGKSTGYNTDGIGLVTDLQKNLDFAIHGKRVLIMGWQPLKKFVTESIVKPEAYVQPGYPHNVMPKSYASLPSNDLKDLVDFLTTSQG